MNILKAILAKSKNNKNLLLKDINYTYGEFYSDSHFLYKELNKFSGKKKRVIAICTNYSKHYLNLIFAAYRANFLIVLINPVSAEKEKLFIIQNSGANFFLSEKKMFNKSFNKIGNFYLFSFNNKNKNIQKKDRFLIYTSGTTSKPKGVILTDDSISSNIKAISLDLKLKNNDTSIIFSPPNYAMAISQIFTYMFNGMSFIFVSTGLKFSNSIINSIIAHKINILNISISALRILKPILKKNSLFLKHVRIVMAGGMQMTNNDLSNYKKFFPRSNIVNFYGCTENSPRISHYHINRKKKYQVVPVGKPLKGVKIKIMYFKAKYGSIFVSGTSLMRGYYNQKIKKKINNVEKGWFNTGDIGYQNSNNEIVLYGREDDIFRVGHEKLAPEEVEPILKKKLNLSDLIVTRKKNKILNWEPVLVILSKDKFKINIKKIKIKLNSFLSNYKIPSKIFTLNSFPKNMYGKIDRNKIYEKIKNKKD